MAFCKPTKVFLAHGCLTGDEHEPQTKASIAIMNGRFELLGIVVDFSSDCIFFFFSRKFSLHEVPPTSTVSQLKRTIFNILFFFFFFFVEPVKRFVP